MGPTSKQFSLDGPDCTQNLLLQNRDSELPELSRDPQHQQRQQQSSPLRCPRCHSTNTKFCYYNNHSKSQPRHLCKACRRHWTQGGALRNVPIGGACRNKCPKTTKTDKIKATIANFQVNQQPEQQQQQLRQSPNISSALHEAPLEQTPELHEHINGSDSGTGVPQLIIPIFTGTGSLDSDFCSFPSLSNRKTNAGEDLLLLDYSIGNGTPLPFNSQQSSLQIGGSSSVVEDWGKFWNWENLALFGSPEEDFLLSLKDRKHNLPTVV